MARAAKTSTFDDDVSLMDDDDDSQSLQASTAVSGQTAQDTVLNSTWDDVVEDELATIAANIARHAMPSAIGLELGGTSEVGTSFTIARTLEEGSNDPLGVGRLDLQNLQLAPFGSSAGGVDMPSAASKAVVKKSGYMHIRNQILPSSRTFDPYAYLGVIHNGSGLQQLMNGTQHLKQALGEQTTQLRILVRENFERFISCKNTIDDIEKGLKAVEQEEGDATNTTEVLSQLKEVHKEAHKTFAPLLDRQQYVQSLQRSQRLLTRYDALLRLPSRLRCHARQQDYEQVITDYRNACTLKTGLAQMDRGAVWDRLFQEVDKVLEELCLELMDSMSSPDMTVSQALEAIKHVLQLKADGVPCLQHVDPIDQFMSGQVKTAQAKFKGLLSQHQEALRLAEPAARVSMARAESTQSILPFSSSMASIQEPSLASGVAVIEELIITLVRRQTEVVTDLTTRLASITQERLATMPGIPPSAVPTLATLPTTLNRSLDVALEPYRNNVINAVHELGEMPVTGPGDWVLICITELADAYVALRKQHAPGYVLSLLQGLVTDFVPDLLKRWTKYLEEYVIQVFGWIPTTSQRVQRSASSGARLGVLAANTSISAIRQKANDLAYSGMQRLLDNTQLAVAQGERMDIPCLVNHEVTREHFTNAYMSIAIKIDELVSQDTQGGLGSEERAREWILSLLMFAHDVRVHAHPELSKRYYHLLFGENDERIAQALSLDVRQDMESVEGRMLSQYKELCYVDLDAALEDYFLRDGTLWDAAAFPKGIRPSCSDLIQLLVGLEAQLYLHAPVVLCTVLTDLTTRLFQVYPAVLSQQLQSISGGGLLQLWVEVLYLERVLKRFFNKQVEEVFDSVRADLWQRLMDAETAIRGQAVPSAPSVVDWATTEAEGMVEEALKATKLNTECLQRGGMQNMPAAYATGSQPQQTAPQASTSLRRTVRLEA